MKAVANIRAYQLFPWDAQIRQQLFVTVVAAEGKGIKLGPNVYEQALRIAETSSPHHPFIQMHKRGKK